MIYLAEYSNRIADLEKRIKENALKAKIDIDMPERADDRFRIVFVGQYSAGKSTIIKAMTGREDIKIGGGITTQDVEDRSWSGLTVTDTPGIKTEKNAEHDEKTEKAIAAADMLVFVTTYECFNNEIGEYFRKLAIDEHRAEEMILVVNKMSSEEEGNTPELQEAKKENINRVIKPFNTDQLEVCFIDAKSYLKGIKKQETDPEAAAEYFEESRFNDFIETLNRFALEKKKTLTMTTRLYELVKILSEAIQKHVLNKDEDIIIRGLENKYSNDRRALAEEQKNIKENICTVFRDAASKIRTIGADAANGLTEYSTQEEMAIRLSEAVIDANELIESCQDEAFEELKAGVSKAGQTLDGLEKSDFTADLKKELAAEWKSHPDKYGNVLNGIFIEGPKCAKTIAGIVHNKNNNGEVNLENFTEDDVNGILDAAKKIFKIKYKPWQKVKLKRGMMYGTQIFDMVGFGVDVFNKIRLEREENKRQEAITENRRAIIMQFNNAAAQLEKHGRKYANVSIEQKIGAKLKEIDEKLQKIRGNRQKRDDACGKLGDMIQECWDLIIEIQGLDPDDLHGEGTIE